MPVEVKFNLGFIAPLMVFGFYIAIATLRGRFSQEKQSLKHIIIWTLAGGTFFFFFILLPHELGHLITAQFLGYDVKELGFNFNRGYVITQVNLITVPTNEISNAVTILAAGPAVNIVQGMTTIILGIFLSRKSLLKRFLFTTSLVALVFATHNLIPSYYPFTDGTGVILLLYKSLDKEISIGFIQLLSFLQIIPLVTPLIWLYLYD